MGVSLLTDGGRHPYNRHVNPQPLALDTTPETERRQVEAWRRMRPAEKLALVLQMSANVRQLALAAYPEIDTLDRP